VGILTDHCLAASLATTLGILYSRTCRKCDESGAIETLEHLICNCPVLSRARRRYLGAPVLASLGDASSRKPGELLAFAKNTSILVDIKSSKLISMFIQINRTSKGHIGQCVTP